MQLARWHFVNGLLWLIFIQSECRPVMFDLQLTDPCDSIFLLKFRTLECSALF